MYLRYGGQKLKEMDKSLIGSQYRFMLIWQMTISIFVYAVLPFFIQDSVRLYVWRIICIYLIVANATWCLGYIFQAGNETKLYSIANMISKLLFIFFVFFAWVSKNVKVEQLIGVYLITQVAALV